MAGYAAANIVDFVRGFGQRKEAARVKEEMKNYLTAPEATISAVNQINPFDAIKLKDDYTADKAAEQKRTDEKNIADQKRVLTSVSGMAQTLRRARDEGLDLGTVFDSTTPLLKNGLGMTDDEIVSWRAKIIEQPDLLDVIGKEAEEKLQVLSPGSIAVNEKGEVITRNPNPMKAMQVGRGDGGKEVITFDPETGEFQVIRGSNDAVGTGTPAPATGTGTGASVTGGTAPRGVRNNNEGNLKDGPFARSQPGYIGSDGTFAKFATPEAGRAVQEKLLAGAYVGQGFTTVNSIVDKYLGKGDSENSPASRANYKAYVARQLGIDPNQPISQNDVPRLAQAMREFENGGASATTRRASPGFSTPGKPPKADYRILTPAEKKAAGLDPTQPYQINGDNGKIERISTGPAGKGAKLKVSPQEYAARRDATMNDAKIMQDAARSILNDPAFNQATGSIQGMLPSITQGSVDFDVKLSAFRDQVVLNAIKTLKNLSATGATGFGNLTEKEGARLENSRGTLNARSPSELRKTLLQIEKDAKVIYGYALMDGAASPDSVRLLVNKPSRANIAAFNAAYGEGKAEQILGR